MKSNFLYDKNFLQELFGANERIVFARVTALTQKERPIEYIEGKVTGGSINVDGTSRVRRTCSLTLVAQDININDFYWGVKNKFKLEIGLKNNIDSKYPDICWFKQGLYVITSFSTSYGTNNYTINISGKDKMCLLNGDLAGALPHTTDFGIEEYYDKENNITTYTSVPLNRIIRESVQNFGNELPQNIIVNDLEDAGLNLLEYRGDTPIYMFRNVDTDTFINMTLNGSLECYIDGVDGEEKVSINDVNKIKYDNLVNLTEGEQPTKVKIGSNYYTIAKFEYGSIPGYELTDLVYAGDLICNVGETLTSMLDKIVDMLGEFEYFYNLDGEFVFQKKQTYVDVYWNDIEKGDQIYANAAVNKSTPMWNFTDNRLVSTFQNTPNILNLRNDFAIWGKKKTTSGTEIDIHMRYAIDKKPTDYYSLIDEKWYSTTGEGSVDWRELIYKMALDYRRFYHDDNFLYKVASSNVKKDKDGNIIKDLYPDGHTGYEQYYVDMEGFWRQIYDPDGEQTVSRYEQISSETAAKLYGQQGNQQNDVFIKNAFVKAKDDELKSMFGESQGKNIFLIEDTGIIKPYLYGACYIKTGKENPENRKYYSLNRSTDKMTEIDTSKLGKLDIKIEEVYVNNIRQLTTSEGKVLTCLNDNRKKVILQAKRYSLGGVPTQDNKQDNKYIQLIGADLEDYIAEGDNNPLRIQSPEYLNFADLKDPVKQIYYSQNTGFMSNFSYNEYGIAGEKKDKSTSKEIQYYSAQYDYGSNGWAKIVTSNPESLIFWFDFLDAEGSNLEKYSVNAIGTRSKAVSDNNVKCIYYREIPQTIFQSGAETYEHQTGYTYIQLRPEMKNLFVISSKGKSAQEELENMLYKYSYSIESANITVLPVYHLEPNTRILIKDQNSKINGEYIVSRIIIPLTYNGTMSLTATKVISNIT